VGNLGAEGFNTNPRQFSRDLIRVIKKNFTVSLSIVSNYYLFSCFQ